jgi:hypothetical protein
VAAGVVGDQLGVLVVMGDGVRAWADEGHVAEDDVEELRQLVEIPAAQPGSDPGDARVVLFGLLHDGAVVERSHGYGT